MKNELKDEFCLRYKKGDIARAVFALVFFGGIEKYSIREITEAHEEKHHIILYTINAEIGKISKDCENFLLLQERLTYEGIIMRSQ